MKNQIVRVLLFIIFVCWIAWINLMVFRTDFPSLAFITIIGSVILFIYFPYNKFFKLNNKN